MNKHPSYYNKREPKFKLKKAYNYRVWKFNDAYICALSVEFIPGGYSAWGSTREDAVHNTMALAGDNIKL